MSRHIRDRDEYERGSKWFADWHREQPDDNAKMIDLDGVGFCHVCMMPLYLVEATRQKSRKTAVVTENLGQLAGLEVLVFYLDEEDARYPDHFFVDWRSQSSRKWMTKPQAWELLMSIRRTHLCALSTREAS